MKVKKTQTPPALQPLKAAKQPARLLSIYFKIK